jgi:hypothetical protein
VNANEGWGLIVGPHTAHYFRDGRSLCNRWAALGGFRPYTPRFGKQSCCATCWRKREKELAHDRIAESGQVVKP